MYTTDPESEHEWVYRRHNQGVKNTELEMWTEGVNDAFGKLREALREYDAKSRVGGRELPMYFNDARRKVILAAERLADAARAKKCATCGRPHVMGVWWPRHPFNPADE